MAVIFWRTVSKLHLLEPSPLPHRISLIERDTVICFEAAVPSWDVLVGSSPVNLASSAEVSIWILNGWGFSWARCLIYLKDLTSDTSSPDVLYQNLLWLSIRLPLKLGQILCACRLRIRRVLLCLLFCLWVRGLLIVVITGLTRLLFQDLVDLKQAHLAESALTPVGGTAFLGILTWTLQILDDVRRILHAKADTLPPVLGSWRWLSRG
jgi:hypothetical protein